MTPPDPAVALPEHLAAAWPPEAWADVHVLAAVSGGADSVALARALVEAKAAHGSGRVFVGHVNHQLRGAASDADEQWLCLQCRQWGTPLIARRADVHAVAGRQGDGLEAAARQERYRLLIEMAHEVGARFVAVAHTREDQVETALFRLLRGSGLRGLAGMPSTRPLSPSVTLVRPLLGISRGTVRKYLADRGQSWREDATNAEPAFARNRVRTLLLPLLREQFNPEVDAAVAGVAQQAAEAQDVLETLAGRLLAACQPRGDAAGLTLAVDPLAGQPPLLAAEALRAAWRGAGWPEQAMTRDGWRRLAGLAQGPEGSPAINLPGNIIACRSGSRLSLRPAR